MSNNKEQQMELQFIVTKQIFFNNFNSKPKQNKNPHSYLLIFKSFIVHLVDDYNLTSHNFLITVSFHPKLAPLAL
jgi:hypothetical protein